MSSFSSWSFTSLATFWEPVNVNEFSEVTSWIRHSIRCSFIEGGEKSVDDSGEEFVPRETIWLESSVGLAPKTGWKVYVGEDSSSSPPNNSNVVRRVKRFDASTFNSGVNDYEVTTG